ncbi:RasGEF [Phlyctochytrium planicorne]|nr:RasGEF [Phlyctochytrium planicorne]
MSALVTSNSNPDLTLQLTASPQSTLPTSADPSITPIEGAPAVLPGGSRTASPVPSPLLRNLSSIQHLSRSSSIGSFTSTSAQQQQQPSPSGNPTPLQIIHKKVSMASLGTKQFSRQQSLSVPDLDTSLATSGTTPTGLSMGQPLRNNTSTTGSPAMGSPSTRLQRADSENLEERPSRAGRGLPESRISMEFYQETLDSVADLLRPSRLGGSTGLLNERSGGGGDLFFRPASFQLDPSLKPTVDIGMSAHSITELASPGYDELVNMYSFPSPTSTTAPQPPLPSEPIEQQQQQTRPVSPNPKRDGGFFGGSTGRVAPSLQRGNSGNNNLSASDLLIGASFGSSLAMGGGDSILGRTMSCDDAFEDDNMVQSRHSHKPRQHGAPRTDSTSRLSQGPLSASSNSPGGIERRLPGDRLSGSVRNSLNVEKDLEMYGGIVRPRTASLSSNNSKRFSAELSGRASTITNGTTGHDTNKPLPPVPFTPQDSSPMMMPPSLPSDNSFGLHSFDEDDGSPRFHHHHPTHLANQSCPAQPTWRSVGSLSEGHPNQNSTKSPSSGTPQNYPSRQPIPGQFNHARRQSEGGANVSSTNQSHHQRSVSLASATSSPNFVITGPGSSTGSSYSSMGALGPASSLPNIEYPQRARLGPFWVSKDRLTWLQGALQEDFFEGMGFSIASLPPSANPTEPLPPIIFSPWAGDGPGLKLGEPNPPVVFEESDGKSLVRGATLPTLVHLLSSQGIISDPDFMTDFLRTYRYFADSVDVARLLMLRYLEIGWSMDTNAVGGGGGGGSSSGTTSVTSSTTALHIDTNVSRYVPPLPVQAPPSEKKEKEVKEKKGLAAWMSGSSSKDTKATPSPTSTTSSTPTPSTTSNTAAAASAGKELDGFLQLRVLNVFKKWIEAHPDDFSRNPNLHDLVRIFLDRHVKTDPKRILFVASILKNLEERAPLQNHLQHAHSGSMNVSSTASLSVPGGRAAGAGPSKLHMVSTASSTSVNQASSASSRSSPQRSRNPSVDVSSTSTGDLRQASSTTVSQQQQQQQSTKKPNQNTTSTGSLHNPSNTPSEQQRPRSATLLGSNSMLDASDDQQPGTGLGLGLRRGSRTSAPSSISLTLALSMLEPPKIAMGELDPTLIAQQLTLMEHNQFRKIRIEEFYCQAWNLPHATGAQKSRSRLASLISWFNRVAYGVASEVVLQPKVKDRVGVLKRFIFIAHLCLKWNNFNTVFEIVAGLNLGAITRLKKTWKALPSKYWDVWNTLNRTVSDEGSYRTYRQAIVALKDRKPEIPILPYLGVNLKDLTFAEDGNPTHLSPTEVSAALKVPQEAITTEKMINFTKFRLLSKLLENISASQKGSYDFKADDKIQIWLKEDWVALDTADLYEHSRQCEPRQPVST